MTIEQLYQLYLQHPQVQTDTRKLQPGELFFALSGENFNGNRFALDALAKGAAYAVVDEDVAPENPNIIKVENALEALQELALHHRRQFTIPFIAITGSNGKTTTKELVNAVLASHYTTYTTKGNLNNHIGVPLTLLSIKKDAEIAIIEMGANHQREIAGYCTYALPNFGIITNCGKAHLEGFGGVEGVRKGKGELFDHLRAHGGTAFIFDDYDYLHTMSHDLAKVLYGTQNGLVTGTAVGGKDFLEVALSRPMQQNITTNLVGDYNLPNVLCALAVGHYFKVPFEKMVQAIAEYAPENSRSQMVLRNGNHIILDAYNANPTSMAVAVKNLAAIDAPHKILLLGGMMELGDESIAEHQALVDLIAQYQWHKVVLVGGDFARVQHPYFFFDAVDQARQWYQNQQFSNTYQLIKGSRSMKMEKVLE